MAERKGKKRTLISISSSSSEEEEEEQSQSESESEDDEHDPHDDDSVEEICASTSCDDEDDESESDDQEYEEDESSENDDLDNDDEAESVCDRVTRLLREGSDLLDELNLTECKAFLRKHGLRLSGTKVDCIQRIKEHWRIKDGNGEALYSRSSFTINCTGDVCKGDVVLFTQKVYEKFDKVRRRGSLLGKRTIAGRIIKESYGAAKQQHTFTVEVLWSKGLKKLPPLFPLLVKGRNLYKLKTFRQRWKNEVKRSNVLAEKHKRGAEARRARAMKKTLPIYAGTKRQKLFHHQPSQMKQRSKPDKGKSVDIREKARVRNVKSNDCHQKPLPVGQVNLKQTSKSRACTSYERHPNFTRPNRTRDFTNQPYSYLPQSFHHQRTPSGFPPCAGGSTSSMTRLPHFRPYADCHMMPASDGQGFNHVPYPHHAYSDPTYEFEPRNFNRFPGLMNTYRPLHPFPPRTESYSERKYGF